jgi:hypothetical protein
MGYYSYYPQHQPYPTYYQQPKPKSNTAQAVVALVIMLVIAYFVYIWFFKPPLLPNKEECEKKLAEIIRKQQISCMKKDAPDLDLEDPRLKTFIDKYVSIYLNDFKMCHLFNGWNVATQKVATKFYHVFDCLAEHKFCGDPKELSSDHACKALWDDFDKSKHAF